MQAMMPWTNSDTVMFGHNMYPPPPLDLNNCIMSDCMAYSPQYDYSCSVSPTDLWFSDLNPQPQPTMVRAEIRERSDNWGQQETQTLLNILIQHKRRFQNIRRHPELWAEVADQLKAIGYPRSVEKCKNRWKVLVAKYKRCFNYQRDSPCPTSNEPNHPQHFEYFFLMDQLLHSKFTKGPASLIRKFKINQSSS